MRSVHIRAGNVRDGNIVECAAKSLFPSSLPSCEATFTLQGPAVTRGTRRPPGLRFGLRTCRPHVMERWYCGEGMHPIGSDITKDQFAKFFPNLHQNVFSINHYFSIILLFNAIPYLLAFICLYIDFCFLIRSIPQIPQQPKTRVQHISTPHPQVHTLIFI